MPFRASYACYLGILLWAPLPVGSNPVFYRLLLSCLLLACGLLFLLEATLRRSNLLRALRPFAIPLILLALVLVWVGIQILPMKLEALQAIAPVSASYYRNAGLSEGAISISPATTAMSGLFTLALLVDFLIVGQWFGFEELAARLENTSMEDEDRDEQVEDALAMVRASPVTGYGLGTYYGNTLFLENSRTFYEHAHNDYLEFTAELGLVGMVPLALLVLSSAVMAVSAMRQRRRRLAKGAGFASSMGILALLIHSLVDFNLQIPANALLFVFMLALGWMARRHDWAREDAEDSAT